MLSSVLTTLSCLILLAVSTPVSPSSLSLPSVCGGYHLTASNGTFAGQSLAQAGNYINFVTNSSLASTFVRYQNGSLFVGGDAVSTTALGRYSYANLFPPSYIASSNGGYAYITCDIVGGSGLSGVLQVTGTLACKARSQTLYLVIYPQVYNNALLDSYQQLSPGASEIVGITAKLVTAQLC